MAYDPATEPLYEIRLNKNLPLKLQEALGHYLAWRLVRDVSNPITTDVWIHDCSFVTLSFDTLSTNKKQGVFKKETVLDDPSAVFNRKDTMNEHLTAHNVADNDRLITLADGLKIAQMTKDLHRIATEIYGEFNPKRKVPIYLAKTMCDTIAVTYLKQLFAKYPDNAHDWLADFYWTGQFLTQLLTELY